MALTGDNKLINLGQLESFGTAVDNVTDKLRTDANAAVKRVRYTKSVFEDNDPSSYGKGGTYNFYDKNDNLVNQIETASEIEVAMKISSVLGSYSGTITNGTHEYGWNNAENSFVLIT